MRKTMLVLALFFCAIGIAQTTKISGRVIDNTGVPIPRVNVIIEGTTIGTTTDFDGYFTLETEQPLPFNLEASTIGFEPSVVNVSVATDDLYITMQEGNLLDLIVISASRAPERLFESPVSVERLGVKEVKNTASADFYGGLENLKAVDINTNSLTFKSVNTRGFATFTNRRFVQLIDGMDNSSPSLNFPLGNLLGINELDVDNIELLPGASSALYGANAFNGILFMNSKNPFDNPGISAYSKGGVTSQDAAGSNGFYDVGFRAAHKFSDYIAAKVNFSYLNGTDWHAVNTANQLNPGLNRDQDPVYNGVNVYGDEIRDNIPGIGFVSRTGYEEQFLTDYNAENLKFDGALHIRPFDNDFEFIYTGKYGKGQTIFQDTNRFSLNDFIFQQHKFEIKNDHFFARYYVSFEDAGDTYDLGFTGINIDKNWKSKDDWFADYGSEFQAAIAGGADVAQAHIDARAFADNGRPEPGTPEFETAFNAVISNPDFQTGSLFKSKTQLRHSDLNYNMSHMTKDFADIQVGGSFRQFALKSDGTIFTDEPGEPIRYNEFGVYTQIQRKFADDRIKLTGSIRYDKSDLFDGNFSPRLSIGYTLGKDRNRNLRASVQTGFRNPAAQDLYLGLDIGEGVVIGSAPDNLDRFSRVQNGIAYTGRIAYENSFTADSVEEFARTLDPTVLEVANPDVVQPEKVTAFEIGYRADFGKLLLDLSGYLNQYKNFISTKDVVSPLNGTVGSPEAVASLATPGGFVGFQTVTNSDVDISSFGAVIGITANVFNGYDLSASYTYTKQDFDENEDPGFRTNFNTPEHKAKLSFGNENLFKNFGFNTALKWSGEYIWESSFATGEIPSFTVLDAQLNYRIPSLKATLKAGGANLTGSEYFTAIGTGFIGAQYYIGLTINNL